VRGTASDISVAADRTVMTASSSGQLSRYVPATDSFTLVPGEAFFIALAPDGTPWGLLQDGTVVRCRAVPCERVGFNATNIAIGPDGSVFIVTFSRELRRFNAETGLFDIIPVPGHTPVLVAVGPFGRPWVITTTGKVLSSRYFERDESADLTTASSTVTPTTGTGDVSTVLGTTSEGGGFTFNRNMQFTSAFAGCAAGDDIVLGVDGTAIMRCGFSELFRYNTTTRTFQPLTNVPTSAVVALDIDAEGRIWFVDGAVNGRIYRQRQRNGSAYDTLTYPAGTGAFARDFVLGPNGTAYVINSGGELYRRTLEATSFTKMISGAWTRVAVGVSNDIWLIDPEERLFQLVGNTVERRPPSGTQPNTTDIGGARDGTIYAIQFYSGVDSGATLYRWNATNRAFDRVNRLADRVDVAPNGRPWIMNLGESGAYFAR
jgi:streptogramin lyase